MISLIVMIDIYLPNGDPSNGYSLDERLTETFSTDDFFECIGELFKITSERAKKCSPGSGARMHIRLSKNGRVIFEEDGRVETSRTVAHELAQMTAFAKKFYEPGPLPEKYLPFFDTE